MSEPESRPILQGGIPDLVPDSADDASPKPPADPDTRPMPRARSSRAPKSRRVEIPGYVIEKEIGAGGMGVIFKARDTKLNRAVALKMMIGGVHARPIERSRFKNEAEAIDKLQHPNIVQIFGSGEWEGHFFLALEYCGGGNLADKHHLRSPPRRAANMIEKLALAAHYAHEQGVVHRDLKPSNVLLTADGIP